MGDMQILKRQILRQQIIDDLDKLPTGSDLDLATEHMLSTWMQSCSDDQSRTGALQIVRRLDAEATKLAAGNPWLGDDYTEMLRQALSTLLILEDREDAEILVMRSMLAGAQWARRYGVLETLFFCPLLDRLNMIHLQAYAVWLQLLVKRHA